MIERDYFLRVGYQGSLENNQIGGLTGFTAGAGLRIGPVRLDYAFVPYGDLGTSHRVSVGYEFNNPPPKPVTVISPPVTLQAPPVTVVATPGPTPVATGGIAKTKVEVLFDLPGAMNPTTGNAQASTLAAPYEKAVQEYPGDSRAWRNLGIVYFRIGQNALGIQCLEQALRLNPADQTLRKWLDEYHAKQSDQR